MEFPKHFGTRAFQESDLEEVVKGIHLAGYLVTNNLESEQDRSPTNHWNMVLELENQNWVKLDMIPNYTTGEPIGYILLESKEHVMTDESVKSVTFIPKGELRVKDVIKVIMENGRDRYIFTEEGEGCRFWVCTVIQDLEAAGEVDKDSAIIAIGTLSHNWTSPSIGILRDMEAGKFF